MSRKGSSEGSYSGVLPELSTPGDSKKPASAAKVSRTMLGRWGEEQAAGFLAEKGFSILERNWRAKSGELDLIASDNETLVFVEVRTRRAGSRFGTAEESVDWRKQKQVREIASYYLHCTNRYGTPCRFDVVAITYDISKNQLTAIRHIPNAF